MSGELVLVNGKPVNRTGLSDEGYAMTTDEHLRALPVIVPVLPARAAVRGKTARRRANSRVSVSWTPKGVGWRK